MDDESKAGDAAPASETYAHGNRVIRRLISTGDGIANRIADVENAVVTERNRRIEELEAELADMKSASAPRGKEAEELRAGIERILKERPSDENAGDIYWARALQTMLDEIDARDSYSYLTVIDELAKLRAYRDSTHEAEERIKTALDQLEGSHPGALIDCIKRVIELLMITIGPMTIANGKVTFRSLDGTKTRFTATTDPKGRIRVSIGDLDAPTAPAPAIEIDAELFEEGYWLPCSGCHESDEGHPTGPWSDTFRCNLGSGCHECGGIGAVWELAYDHPSRRIDAAPETSPLEAELRAARAEISRLKGSLAERPKEHDDIAAAINSYIPNGPEYDEERNALQRWLNAQVNRAREMSQLEMMIVDVADDTLGLQEVAPSDELLSRLNQRVVNDHAKINELERRLETRMDDEARAARNTLGAALIEIDGQHSSALTICADRAAELLATQVTLLGEQKLRADTAEQEVTIARKRADELRGLLVQHETAMRKTDHIVVERDELRERLAKEQINREMFEERALFAEAEQRKAMVELEAMRQADIIVTRNFKHNEERSRQWQDESLRSRRERNLRTAERDEAWANAGMLARHLYGCVELARGADLAIVEQLAELERIAVAAMADALTHVIAVAKGLPPSMLTGTPDRSISDVLARRIELEMMGPEIPERALDGLYPDAEVRRHFYDLLQDLSRLTVALDRMFPNRPRAGVGSIDAAIGLVEQLKAARDQACEIVLAFFEEAKGMTDEVAKLAPNETSHITESMMTDARDAMESIRAKVDQLLAIGVES
jgi:hypothetical protein